MNSLTGQYLTLYQQLSKHIPVSQLITDPFQTQVYGTDASFYRLQPKLIVVVDDIEQVSIALSTCNKLAIPICFRAAGTSLSGQAITDSVLIKLSDQWQDFTISDHGELINMACGVLGSAANQALVKFKRKLGPMPASIDAATAGGMAINNAAGMNSLDSYGQMQSARFLFANGSRLDTIDAENRQQFASNNVDLIKGISRLRDQINNAPELVSKIRTKFAIKNTTGYSLRAFIDYHDPIDIIAHLMIGSEGTLGFIESIRHHTVPIYPQQATALVLFENLAAAGQAIQAFKRIQFGDEQGASTEAKSYAPATKETTGSASENGYHNPYIEPTISATELIDANALRAVADRPGMPSSLNTISNHQVALLVQVEAPRSADLQAKITNVTNVLASVELVEPVAFSQDPVQIDHYWQMRKAIFPAVGANRPADTTALIEDVAFPINVLPTALNDLQALLHDFGYHDAVIYGHALDGNLHFIFSQNFSEPSELTRYKQMMIAVTELVVDKYQGSLKAEHGTGRNMAPFVEKEWGAELYQVMQTLKTLFDPNHILNPDVMLTQDKDLFIKNIKPIFSSNELIDKCIECGFCERQCPSKTITFTPRQRIIGYREIEYQAQCGVNNKAAKSAFSTLADQTCAGCGLCETSCPVDINVGDLIREHRAGQNKDWQKTAADVAQKHFGTLIKSMRGVLPLVSLVQPMLPTKLGRAPAVPKPLSMSKVYEAVANQPNGLRRKVVLFSSCVSRGFAYDNEPQTIIAIVKVMNRAGFEVVLPKDLDNQCCGLPFASKGFPEQAKQAQNQLQQTLWQATEQGRWPVLTDTSQCAAQLLDSGKLDVQDPLAFIAESVLPKLTIQAKPEPIAFHLTCSARKNNQGKASQKILQACAQEVVEPKSVTCCGFAGDKGFSVPELNQSALKGLAAEVRHCEQGYSTSRTCELGLSHHSGIKYQSLFFLLEECSRETSLNETSDNQTLRTTDKVIEGEA